MRIRAFDTFSQTTALGKVDLCFTPLRVCSHFYDIISEIEGHMLGTSGLFMFTCLLVCSPLSHLTDPRAQ